MKTEKLNFQWFEKEDRRKPLRASLGRDGKLRLGEELRKRLPPTIRLGFDIKNRILAIGDGYGKGIDWPKTGHINAQALCNEICSTGIKLPVIFTFAKDSSTGFFLGRISPNLEPQCADVEQLLALYQPVINAVIYQGYRSIPIAERRDCAPEAFCQAVQEYDAGCGDFWFFAEKQMKDRLFNENKKYSSDFMNRSLDAELKNDGEHFTLYDVISDTSSGGISQVEAKIMHQQFLNSLSSAEQKLYAMMKEGCYIEQIAMELSIDEDAVICLGRQIGEKRKAFYAA